MPEKSVSPEGYKIQNGDDLHNFNAYQYLLALKNALNPPHGDSSPSKANNTRVNTMLRNLDMVNPDHYYPGYPYGNLYNLVQQDFDKFTPEEDEDPRLLAFMNALYLNDNSALENTYALIEIPLRQYNHSTSDGTHRITDRLNEGSNESKNTYNPQTMDSKGHKLYGVLGPNFAPQYATSLPSIRHFSYQEGSDGYPTEIRMGTQGQYRLWGPEVSHMFKQWLSLRHQKYQKERKELGKEDDQDHITHIYFNNLGRDRSGIEGNREKAMTTELEKLNEKPGVAVITLPADKGMLSSKKIFGTREEDRVLTQTFKQQVVDIISGKPVEGVSTRDVYIDDKVKKVIYGPPNHDGEKYNESKEEEKLNELLNKSFKTLGLTDKESLTDEQMQAVYFHFVKYELTNHILEKVKPETFNISCKDGIDRAGSASLIYNFMKSIEVGKPMSQAEFEKNLHGPATMVKGRGMNIHRERVWSFINQYVDANYDDLSSSPDKQWIIRWRDMNVPKTKQQEFFSQRAKQILKDIKEGDQKVNAEVQKFIQGCIELGKDVSYDKRFLMDMIYEAKSVSEASTKPNKEESIKEALNNMTDKIKDYPEEIKQPSFMEKVSKLFRNIASKVFKGLAYESTRDKFLDKNLFEKKPKEHQHPTFSQFKQTLQSIKKPDVNYEPIIDEEAEVKREPKSKQP